MSSIDIEIINANEEYVIPENQNEIKIEQLLNIREVREQNPNKTDSAKYGNYTAKCGEIFITNSGKMFYACAFCDMIFKNSESFINHLLQLHLKPEDDFDSDDSIFHSPKHSEVEDNEEDCSSIASEEVKENFQISDDEYAPMPVMDEDPIKVDYLDSLSESDTNENQNANSSLGEEPFLINSTNAADDQLKIEEIIDSEYQCEICSRKFRTEKGLVNHRVRHDFNASPNDIMFENSYNSDDDESKKKNSVKTMNNSLKCNYCGKQFSRTASRVNHERTHTGEKPFKCDECGKTFRMNYQLEAHVRTHTGERPFSCPQCPAKFAQKMNMTFHLRAHLGIKRFACEVCGKRFVRNVEKTIHMRIHTGEKPYQCETCGTSFHLASKLTEHKKRHTNTRPFQCEICRKSFYSKELLRNHKAMHSDERPFECTMCDSKFPRKRALQSHMKIHSDVKEYVCKICGKAFAQNAGLYGHMKSHGVAKTTS